MLQNSDHTRSFYCWWFCKLLWRLQSSRWIYCIPVWYWTSYMCQRNVQRFIFIFLMYYPWATMSFKEQKRQLWSLFWNWNKQTISYFLDLIFLPGKFYTLIDWQGWHIYVVASVLIKMVLIHQKLILSSEILMIQFHNKSSNSGSGFVEFYPRTYSLCFSLFDSLVSFILN